MSHPSLLRALAVSCVFLLLFHARVCAVDGQVDNRHYTHAIVYKSGIKDGQVWLQILRLGDTSIVTNRAVKPPISNAISKEDFEKMWNGIENIADFRAGRIDDAADTVNLSQAHMVVTFQRSKATGRHESTRIYKIALGSESKGFKEWLGLVEKLKSEQVGTGRPASRPESK